MFAARLLGLSTALPLCLACQTAFAAQGGSAPSPRAASILPPVTRALQVRAGEDGGDRLEGLVRELGAATGVSFVISEDVRAMLRQTGTGLVADLTIPPEQGWATVEGLLLHNGYVLTVHTSKPPHVVGVISISPGPRPQRRPLLRVPPEHTQWLREHPALLVQTTVELPHTDVRQLGNSLRGLMIDPSGFQTVMPVGNTSSVILAGTARDVLDLVDMLREIDETSRRFYEQQGQAGAGQSTGAGEAARSPGAAPAGGGR